MRFSRHVTSFLCCIFVLTTNTYAADGFRNRDPIGDRYAQSYRPEKQSQNAWVSLASQWQSAGRMMQSGWLNTSESFAKFSRSPYAALAREAGWCAINPLGYMFTRRAEGMSALRASASAFREPFRNSVAGAALPMMQVNMNTVLFVASAVKGVSLVSEFSCRAVKSSAKTVVDAVGMGRDDAYGCVLRKMGAEGKIVTADMALVFVADPLVGNVRWEKAVHTAAPMAAQALARDYDIVHVPGVNSGGLTPDQLTAIKENVHLPTGSTLLLLHSAGTDAGVRALAQYKGDPNKVYVLAVSPRMAAATFAEHIAASKIPTSHVITVNSQADFPHWPGDLRMSKQSLPMRVLGMTFPAQMMTARTFEFVARAVHNAWHGYDANRGAGTHVEVKELRIGSQVQKTDHGGIIDAFATPASGRFVVNGVQEYKNTKYVYLINKIFGDASEKR
jgi:hypothetical protein